MVQSWVWDKREWALVKLREYGRSRCEIEESYPRSTRWRIALSFRWDGEAGNHTHQPSTEACAAALWHNCQNDWSLLAMYRMSSRMNFILRLLIHMIIIQQIDTIRFSDHFQSFDINRYIAPTIRYSDDVCRCSTFEVGKIIKPHRHKSHPRFFETTVPLNLPRHKVSSRYSTTNKLILNSHPKC